MYLRLFPIISKVIPHLGSDIDLLFDLWDSSHQVEYGELIGHFLLIVLDAVEHRDVLTPLTLLEVKHANRLDFSLQHADEMSPSRIGDSVLFIHLCDQYLDLYTHCLSTYPLSLYELRTGIKILRVFLNLSCLQHKKEQVTNIQ